jgi:hypothetical protein
VTYYDYSKHVQSLPENLYKIHSFCWDYTGRPNLENADLVAIGRLCELSDDWDEFKSFCDRFFFNKAEMSDHTLSLAWHCYVKGMTVLADKLSKKP